MSWVKQVLEGLAADQAIDAQPFGGSMRGRIESGQRVTIEPVTDCHIEIGDAVFVRWKRNYLLHLVKDIAEERYLIGNNVGKINGWVKREDVLGIVTKVHDD
jgi:hypothetical protein